jgi:hypothetical protein
MRIVRAFRPIIMMAFGLALIACSGEKPESVLQTFYQAVATGDAETAARQISYSRIPAGFRAQADGKVRMLLGEMHSRIQANDGLDKIEMVAVNMAAGGKTAKIRTRLKFKNGKEHLQNHRLVREGGDWKIVLG